MPRGFSEDAYLQGSLLGDYYMTIRIGPYVRPEPFREGSFVPNKTIRLPLPQELRDDTSVGYNNVDLESVADLLNGDITSGVGAVVLRNVAQAGTEFAGGIASAIPGDLATQVADGVSSVLPPDQLTTALQQAMGVAPNPNPTVQFTGPNLREFAWTWTLLPVNEVESRRISRLISTLKAAALPRNVFNDQGAILSYPDMCQLNFYPWDSDNPSGDWGWGKNSIIKIKRCMMSSVNVLYTPSNTPAFFRKTQAPVAVQLTIGFKEIEYLLSEDWGGEAGGYDTAADFFRAALQSAGLNTGLATPLIAAATVADVTLRGASSLTTPVSQGDNETAAAINSESPK